MFVSLSSGDTEELVLKVRFLTILLRNKSYSFERIYRVKYSIEKLLMLLEILGSVKRKVECYDVFTYS